VITKTIYKKTSSGKIMTCHYRIVEQADGVYYQAITGYVDGKRTESGPKFVKAKNVGRANETTELEQAQLEVASKMKKKLDAGYKDSIDEAQNELVILPELATKFEDRKSNINWKLAFASYKIDGGRCLIHNGKATTRTAKPYHTVGFLEKLLKDIPENIILDGELYTEEVPFETLIGMIRREKNSPDELAFINKHVKFYIFDMIDLDNLEQESHIRMNRIKDIIPESDSLIIVKQHRVFNEQQAKGLHDKWVSEGWEGAMIRNGNAPYGLNKRTANLQKMKVFDDAEFKIVGYGEGSGNDIGTVIFECEIENGNTFKCRPKGSVEYRRDLFQNGDSYIGKQLTVRFFGKSEYGIPRFPVGIMVNRPD